MAFKAIITLGKVQSRFAGHGMELLTDVLVHCFSTHLSDEL